MDKRNAPSFLWIYAVTLSLTVILLVAGAFVLGKTGSWSLLAAGAIGLVGVLALFPIAISLNSIRQEASSRKEELFSPVTERLDQMSVLMNLISEQQLLSDRARSVAFREKDRDALRRAIREEIAKGDYEAASILVNDMETTFGYRQEGDRFRQEIADRRAEATRKAIQESINVIDRHTRGEQWQQALREAERLSQLYPDSDIVRQLPAEIETRREAFKRQILESFKDATARKDVDGGIEILKKLDTYLTPAEAESLQEDARVIFREKLNRLRVDFSARVQEHNWAEAIRVGETIVRDFPNSGVAREVREKMDAMRARINEQPKQLEPAQT